MNQKFIIQNIGCDYSTGSDETPLPLNFLKKDIVIENIDTNRQTTFSQMTVYLDENCNLLNIPLLLEQIVQEQDTPVVKNFEQAKIKELYYSQSMDSTDTSIQAPHYLLKNMQIAIYDDLSSTFLSLGVEPYFFRHINFTVSQYRNSSTLYFQVSSKYISSAHTIVPQISEIQQLQNNDDLENNTTENPSAGEAPKKRKRRKMNPEKRIKERSIEEVRRKVVEWRQIQEKEKINLDKAAKIIGISRKTLDDYCLQLRKATENGFDFLENKNAKMGILRKFVKQKEKENPQQKNSINNNKECKKQQQKQNFVKKNSDTFLCNQEETAESFTKCDDIDNYFNFNNDTDNNINKSSDNDYILENDFDHNKLYNNFDICSLDNNNFENNNIINFIESI